MDKHTLMKYIELGYSTNTISKMENKSQTAVMKWLKKFGLKTKHKKISVGFDSSIYRKYDRKTSYSNLPWDLIQKDYDNGLSCRQLNDKHKLNNAKLNWGSKNGYLKRRSKKDASILAHKKFPNSFKISNETKLKISKSRIKYLQEHPDKVPYVINHSSKKSYPEQVFENALISSGLTGWKYKYRNGIYEYDFAFPDLKIDVEVDGGTHKTEKVKKIDRRRDEWSKSQGWTIIRFEAEIVKRNVTNCINILKNFMAL